MYYNKRKAEASGLAPVASAFLKPDNQSFLGANLRGKVKKLVVF